MDDEPENPAPFDLARHRRGGRPALPEAERRGHHIGVYVTTDEKAQIFAFAHRAAADSVSEYLRSRAVPARAEHGRQQATPDVDGLYAEVTHLGFDLRHYLDAARAGSFPPEAAATVAAIEVALKQVGPAMRALADCPLDCED